MSGQLPRLLSLLVLACAATVTRSALVEAAPVYQWKDASGQTVYSDQPPPSGTPAEQVQMPAPPTAADVEAAQQRTKAMQEQADQLAQERRQREQRAAEAAQQAAAAKALEPEDEEPDQQPYFDAQPYYPDRQPIFRPRPPFGDLPARPAHPIVRPGLPQR